MTPDFSALIPSPAAFASPARSAAAAAVVLSASIALLAALALAPAPLMAQDATKTDETGAAAAAAPTDAAATTVVEAAADAANSETATGDTAKSDTADAADSGADVAAGADAEKAGEAGEAATNAVTAAGTTGARVPVTPSCLKPQYDNSAKDYRDRSSAGVAWLNIVEQYHFYPAVRRMTLEPVKLGGELAYILNRIPNHHRALHLVVRLEAREGMLRYSGPHTRSPRFAYCFLDKARKYARNDPTVEMLIGIYFHKRDAYDQALTAYGRALELEPAFSEAHYNLGLLHFDRKDYAAASASARKAAELGYPLTALRKKLARGGHWKS